MDKLIKNEFKKLSDFLNSAYQEIESAKKAIEDLSLKNEDIKDKYNDIIKIKIILKDAQTLIKDLKGIHIKTFYESEI